MVQNSRISNGTGKGSFLNIMGCSSVYGEAECNWWSSVFLWECPCCHLILHVPCWVETLHSLCCLISLWQLMSLAFPSLKNFPFFSPTLMIALSSLCSPSFSPFIPNDSVPPSSFPSSLCVLFLEPRTVTLKSLPQPKFLFSTQGRGHLLVNICPPGGTWQQISPCVYPSNNHFLLQQPHLSTTCHHSPS